MTGFEPATTNSGSPDSASMDQQQLFKLALGFKPHHHVRYRAPACQPLLTYILISQPCNDFNAISLRTTDNSLLEVQGSDTIIPSSGHTSGPPTRAKTGSNPGSEKGKNSTSKN